MLKRTGRDVSGQGARIVDGRTDAERDGIRIGRRVRFNEAAKAAIESAADVAAATGTAIDWSAEWTHLENDETFTLQDARDHLAAARPRYAPILDREVMSPADLIGIATAAASATAAAINSKTARAARLTDEEYGDLRAWLIVKALEVEGNGSPRWRAIEGNTDATAAAGTLTRAEEADSYRGRWIGYLILHGKAWRRERAERMTAESAAETDDRTDDEKAAAEVAAAGATVGDVAARLEAAGRPLTKAERLTLEAALLKLSRRELAERYGHSADYIKTTLKRGRASLAQRWETPSAARRDIESSATAALENERRSLTGRARTADVLRWTGEAEAMVTALVAAAWQEPMSRPATDSSERTAAPRKGRRILPIQPRTLALPPLGWAHRRTAELAALEARIGYTAQGFPLQNLAAYIG